MKTDNLRRDVSGFSAFIMVIGTIIGSGIFFKPTAVFSATGTAGLGMIAWVIGGLLALAGGLTVAEIGTLIPETGGMMTYMEKMYGRSVGFIMAWSQMIIFYPARFAAAAVICATQACNLLDLGNSHIVPIAIGIFTLVTLINALGNAATDALQNTATFLKFVPIVIIILAGFFLNHHPVQISLLPVTLSSHPLFSGLSLAVIATLYATDGWMNVTNIAGEMKNPGRDLPRAIVGGIVLVTFVYLTINFAYLRVMPATALAATATPAAAVAFKLFPDFGGKLITVGIMISVFGSLTGFVRAGWRIPYALAIRDLIPFSAWFARLNGKTGMPVNSGLFLYVFTVLCMFIGGFNVLTDIGSFVIWFFYALTFIGVFVLRRKWPDRERVYKVPLYPFVPIAGLFGGLFVLISTLIVQPYVAAMSIIPVVAGIPVYLYQVRKESTRQIRQAG
jgi:APA family basic amino acid/polyamine antiporter